MGFAESSEAIQEFVENLKAAERTLANKDMLKVKAVHFSEASVLKLPQEILYQAWTSANQAARPGTAAGPVAGPAVYSFEINIEFDSLFYQAKPQVAVAAAPAAGVAGRMLGGGGSFARPGAAPGAATTPAAPQGLAIGDDE
jgi:hypothetical protein